LISLHNYFIIHDIKYIFFNKINQTIQEGQKIFQGGQSTESIIEKYCFSKSRRAAAPPCASVHPPQGMDPALIRPIKTSFEHLTTSMIKHEMSKRHLNVRTAKSFESNVYPMMATKRLKSI
jgi:hypothetical protein